MKGLHILFEGECTVLRTSVNCHTVIFIEEIIKNIFFRDSVFLFVRKFKLNDRSG